MAEFALNEGGGVGLKDGRPIRNSVQTSEKGRAEIISSTWKKQGRPTAAVPMKDNAIYSIWRRGWCASPNSVFHFKLNETPRAPIFERIAQFEGEQTAADIRAMLSDRPDPAALSFVRPRGQSGPITPSCAPPCVANDAGGAGQAINALPPAGERPGFNCRVMPGESRRRGSRRRLVRVLADDQIHGHPARSGGLERTFGIERGR